MVSMALKSRLPDLNVCPLDRITGFCFVTLVFFGMLMVASASTEISSRLHDNAFWLFSKHVAFVCAGLIAAGVTLMIPIRVWQRMDWVLLLVAMILLVAVLVPGLGREVNGSTRWIPLGPVSIQSAEFAKLFAIVYMAGYLARRQNEVQERALNFIKPLILMSLLVFLLLAQPDFGSAVVIMSAVMGMIYLAEVPVRGFFPVILIGFLVALGIALLQPYRLERFATFINPWEYQYDAGYQLTQALIAFGRGELIGVGLGNSIQKLFYLPEAHTDFLFSIIAEELGVPGAILLSSLFVVIVLRGIFIGVKARAMKLPFNAYLAFGASLLIGVQALINLGVNLGILPTKGLTLPLVSFGGNSLVVSCVLVALLLRVEYESGVKKRHGKNG